MLEGTTKNLPQRCQIPSPFMNESWRLWPSAPYFHWGIEASFDRALLVRSFNQENTPQDSHASGGYGHCIVTVPWCYWTPQGTMNFPDWQWLSHLSLSIGTIADDCGKGLILQIEIWNYYGWCSKNMGEENSIEHPWYGHEIWESNANNAFLHVS